MPMTDINKVPDADIIAERIRNTVTIHDLEMAMIVKILNDWNEEWISFVAENKTGRTDNTEQARKRDNAKRLKDRINKLEPRSSVVEQVDNPGF